MRKRLLGTVMVLTLAALFFSNDSCMATKSPTFQVWGGSVFSYGDINVSNATARTVGDDQFMFSSWVEYGVFANGGVVGLASGAASSGGSLESGSGDFCKYRTPLSFANYSRTDNRLCGNSVNGKTGFFQYNYPKFNMTTSLEGLRKGGMEIGSDNITIAGRTVSGKEIEATDGGDVRITGDIQYDTSGKYYSLEEVPKLFIYARNIYISCDVTRVDAVMFASDTVYTCATADGSKEDTDYENRRHSTQLTINGAIIAKTVNLGRTYGAVDVSNTVDQTGGEVAAKCQNNVKLCASIPAEIINYDTSLLVTGSESNNTTSQVNLVTMYQRELPPRY